MELNDFHKSTIKSYRSIRIFIFCSTVCLFLTQCNTDNDEIIPLEGNICLDRAEGNLNGGYSLEQQYSEYSFRPLIEQNIVELCYRPSLLLVTQIDNHGLVTYYKININKNAPKVIVLKKARYDKEVGDCTSCKILELGLDTTIGMWKIKDRITTGAQ